MEASHGVQKIITLCEKIFREKVKGTRKDDMRINSKDLLIRKMTYDILRADGESLRTYFPSFAEHAMRTILCLRIIISLKLEKNL